MSWLDMAVRDYPHASAVVLIALGIGLIRLMDRGHHHHDAGPL